MAHGTAITATEYKSYFKLTSDAQYLDLTGELWGIYYEEFEENWPRYNGTALYYVLPWPTCPIVVQVIVRNFPLRLQIN